MNILIYAGIFIFKMIEEALRTLRIIVVSNGKKILGSILQFFIALIWIIVTGTVISNVKNDPWKIIFYALGSLVGSYFGSSLEEKIALGYVEIMTETKEDIARSLIKKLKTHKYNITSIKGSIPGMTMLMITASRKKTNDIIKIIRDFDKDADIVTEKVKLARHRL